MIYKAFPNPQLNLTFEQLCEEPTLDWFSSGGKGPRRRLRARSELTEAELIQIARARRKRPHVDRATEHFIARRRV